MTKQPTEFEGPAIFCYYDEDDCLIIEHGNVKKIKVSTSDVASVVEGTERHFFFPTGTEEMAFVIDKDEWFSTFFKDTHVQRKELFGLWIN